MALTSRGKALVAGGTVVAVLGGGMAALALSGNAPDSIVKAVDKVVPGDQTPQQPCPLTGEKLPGDQEPPKRPALAVKVENAPEARPQAGLDRADVVYEEPVEGGVTRYIVVFHCDDAPRLGPVRSARMTDISVLAQYGKPLFGFAGGAPKVRNEVGKANLVDLNYVDSAEEYVRDESREAPHNLYTTTKKLFKAGASRGSTPEPVFTYEDELDLKAKPAKSIHIPFSTTYADVYWRWTKGRWARSHGSEPHLLESGDQVTAANIVVMSVKVSDSEIVDVAGYASPEVELVGSGKAWIFRDGRVVVGKWIRDREGDVTRLEAKDGSEIPLAPGATWVELVPTTVDVEFSAKTA